MRWRIFAVILAVILAVAVFLFFSQDKKTSPIEINSVFVKTLIKANGSFEEQISVMNSEDFPETFRIIPKGIGGFVLISPQEFKLNSGETKRIKILFFDNGVGSGIYAGSLEINSGNNRKSVPVILEIESGEVLFDSRISIFPMQGISPGDKINAEIKISAISGIGNADVEISYFVKDFSGETLFSETEELIVNEQTNVIKSVDLPDDAAEGDYIFGAVLKHKNSIGTASGLFKVTGAKSKILGFVSSYKYILIIFFVILFVLSIILFTDYENKKVMHAVRNHYEETRKISKRIKRGNAAEKENKEISEKLEKQLNALEKAHSSGYISSKAYVSSKKRIEQLSKNLKRKSL